MSVAERLEREKRDVRAYAKLRELGAAPARLVADELDSTVPLVTASLTRLRDAGKARKITAACPSCGARGRLSLWLYV